MPKATRTRLAERLCGSMVQTRVVGLLYVTDPSGQVRVANAPTHQEITIMMGASREIFTRIFQLLQGRGAVEGDSNNLLMEKPELVHNIAGGGLLDMS